MLEIFLITFVFIDMYQLSRDTPNRENLKANGEEPYYRLRHHHSFNVKVLLLTTRPGYVKTWTYSILMGLWNTNMIYTGVLAWSY